MGAGGMSNDLPGAAFDIQGIDLGFCPVVQRLKIVELSLRGSFHGRFRQDPMKLHPHHIVRLREGQAPNPSHIGTRPIQRELPDGHQGTSRPARGENRLGAQFLSDQVVAGGGGVALIENEVQKRRHRG